MVDPATVGAIMAVQSAVPEIAKDTLKAFATRVIGKVLAGTIGHSSVGQDIRDNLDDQASRSKVKEMLAEEVGRQALADPELVERYKARILGDLWRKQENVDATAQMAEQKIESDPKAEQPVDTPSEPSADWLGAWTREAENASSEELRDRLASILAGEIKSPGTFSRATIRKVGDLDQDTLRAFRDILPRRLDDSIVAEESWSQGKMYTVGLQLEAAGLVIGTSGTGRDLKPDANGNTFLVGEILALVINAEPGFVARVPIWLLTRTGKQIASLLGGSDEGASLRLAFQPIDRNQVKQAHIGLVTRLKNDEINVSFTELLYRRG